MQNTIVKVNLKNVVQNARAFQLLTGKKICAVLKADAYGHGAEHVAFALAEKVDFFAVATETEGLKIKTAVCGKEILVLTPPACERETESLILSGLSLSVGCLEDAKGIVKAQEKLGVPVFVHLKLNTGMNRYGMTKTEEKAVCELFKAQGQVCVQGVYSHLYGNKTRTLEKQRLAFEEGASVCLRYFPNAIRHLSATLGATLSKEFHFDAVRIGIGLYGYLPKRAKGKVPLKKAMKVYARVQRSREYSFGGAGYGELKKSVQNRLRKSGVSVLRVGYADGFFRRKKLKSVNRLQVNDLCMDACLVAKNWQKGGYVAVMDDAEKTAKRTGTSAYEILCASGRRAEFIYEYE